MQIFIASGIIVIIYLLSTRRRDSVGKHLHSIIYKLNIIMSQLSDLKEKLAAQDTALTTIGGNVSGIQSDVAALKQKIADLNANGDAAVAAALNELTPFVDGIGSKIDTIGTTTAALDAETDPNNP
jgi:predicted  nucleic acid-binding Zn-ribbon protein